MDYLRKFLAFQRRQAPQPQSAYSLVSHDAGPAGDADTGSVTLGTVFCNTAPGSYTKIVFWKSAIDTEIAREVTLFDNVGNILAGGVTSNEPAGPAWIEVTLSVSVHRNGADPITADTINSDAVVAAVWYPSGHYGAEAQKFAERVVSGPLVGLAASERSNGLFSYHTAITFPTNSFNNAFYFVDVVFEAD